MNEWLVENYEELKLICKKITRNTDVDDLLHLCIEQFMKNKNIQTIAQTQWLFFFARIVRNNYFSNSSPYSRTYSKYKFSEMHDLEVIDLQYEEPVIE